ncbi:MAG: chemotaxis protein CheA, partial [Ignavibacteria bacterium]|nr:chemotaxis protein CheA [Ignavibacteria bacterium]
NAVDHGVEFPEDRIRKGKDPKGTVTLSAEHEGNNIIITVEDDGKGINPEVLKEKAISKGLITRERANELSRQETYNLIFIPGFSTNEIVSNISGRGVGMDVVKTNVAKLRGLINIESEVDHGTKIIIKLPLTLAIIQGLLVKVDSETVVIPLNSVVEVVRVSNDEIKSINQNEVIRIRDSVLPLLRIDKLLYENSNSAAENRWQYVVIVGIAEKRFGLRVDELVGQKEVVIKSLGNYLGNIQGIAGSTIMGDGKVVMIVDVGELINNLTEENC